jgi:hypothetical protein
VVAWWGWWGRVWRGFCATGPRRHCRLGLAGQRLPAGGCRRTEAAVETSDWFLSAAERGNPATEIDRRRGDGRAWTEGNLVVPIVHGVPYFRRLLAELERLGPGDQVCFCDWRGDPDQLLDDGGPELGPALADLVDPAQGFQAWREAAAAHRPGRVRPWAAWWAWPLYRTLIDPDGRPLSLRRGGHF